MRRLPRRSWIWSRPARFRWMSQKSFKFAVVLKISVRHDGAARGRRVPGGAANDTSRAAASTSESICTIGEKSKNPSIFDQIVSLAAVSAESQHDSGVVPGILRYQRDMQDGPVFRTRVQRTFVMNDLFVDVIDQDPWPKQCPNGMRTRSLNITGPVWARDWCTTSASSHHISLSGRCTRGI
jgi:hypothetical protein